MKLHDTHETLAVSDADISASTFSKAKLADASFDDVDLKRARFNNVNLAGATFDDVNLSNAAITNANLTGMRINGVGVYPLLEARRRPVAVIYVKEIARVRSFYEQVAGFAVAHAEEGHVVLQSAASRLLLVRVPENISAAIELTNPPTRRSENPIKLVLPVASIATAREAAAQSGGELLPADREWEFDGVRVCDGYDPEGNVVQFQHVA